MKILLTSDGSECSDHAARFLAKTLRKSMPDLGVTLFHVDAPMLDRVASALGEARVAEIHRENVDRGLASARRILKRARLPFDEEYTAGNPAQAIARQAKAGRYDLVLMGSHGRTALRNVLLGSVTARVLAICDVPVLVVH